MALLGNKIDPEKWTTQFLLKYGIDNPSVPVEKIAEKEGIELIIASPKGGSVSFISFHLNLTQGVKFIRATCRADLLLS